MRVVGVIILIIPVLLTGCDPPSCVASGSSISTPAGPVEVQHLRVGQKVWAIDPRTGHRVPTPVTAIRRDERECHRLTTTDGTDLTVTDDHPLYSPERDDYLPAALWIDGTLTRLLVVDPEPRITSVTSTVPAGKHPVFDITVRSTLHNFTANGILVHNKTQPGPEVLTYNLITFEEFLYDAAVISDCDPEDALSYARITLLDDGNYELELSIIEAAPPSSPDCIEQHLPDCYVEVPQPVRLLTLEEIDSMEEVFASITTVFWGPTLPSPDPCLWQFFQWDDIAADARPTESRIHPTDANLVRAFLETLRDTP